MQQHTQTQAINRLKIIEGHIKKVREMVEEGAYCPDVIQQSQAVQGALKKVDEVMLHGHLHSCVLSDIHGSQKEKLIEEIISLFQKT
ncbi:metal-sensitive transcriptional regulator [Candidatus Microgenomates bacterium]|nr:metal-sensitive transcriptional regulator [Candidatus Microgenomates bacterium]